MKKLLIISTLCLAACGQFERDAKADDPRTISGIDPAFQPYVELYTQTKGRGFNYDIPIGFSNQSGNVIGVCTRWSNGYRQIQIDPTYWNDPLTTEHEKIALIFHELGHCDLNRGHTTTFLTSGWPISLMHPYNYGYISSMEGYYFHELFNSTSSSTSHDILASHDGGCVHDIAVPEFNNDQTTDK